MQVKEFLNIIGSKFYTGVPDSLLRPLCDYLIDNYGISDKHIIAANEGNSTAIAAGYYMATGKTPVVYMQNSGIGNIINPVVSLLNKEIYAIPCIFIVGWRGEPETKDEPQHIYQGKITDKLLVDIDISVYHIDKNTQLYDVEKKMSEFNEILKQGKSVAFIVSKGGLDYNNKISYKNNNVMTRENVIEQLINISQKDIVVSTTGKASRELFELREKNQQSHKYDFLTVGSMGHTSSIALGVALNKKNKKIWCIDGDGALIMHMGSMAVIGNIKPSNMVHIVINNMAHESVGGMPTSASTMNLCQIALGCGYDEAISVNNIDDLKQQLNRVKRINKLVFIEVKTAIGSRKDLGRPTKTPQQNVFEFMNNLSDINIEI